MHIAFDCRSIHKGLGGIGRAAWELARAMALDPRGHRITLLLGLELPTGFEVPKTDFVQMRAAMIDEPFEQLHLPVILEELGVDVYLNSTFSIPALKTTRYQLSIIHDVVFEDRPEWVAPQLGAYLRRWSRFAASHADRVITVSEHAKGRIQEVYGISPDRITRIYNGIAESSFIEPRNEDVCRVRAKYGLQHPYILYLGTLEPKKGVPELLRAFSVLVRQGFKGSLALAGGSSGFAYDWKKDAAAAGCPELVKVLGYVDEADKRPLLKGSSLFVYPSLYEGFGLPPLEALALGVPCVASSATSIPEVVGEEALLVDVRDWEKFAQALDRALKDPDLRQRAHKEGPGRARGFSWEHSAQAVFDLCESLGAA